MRLNSYLIFFLAALLLTSCKKSQEANKLVTYRINCTDCFVAWEENGEQFSAQHMNSSWSRTYRGQPGSVVLLSAMNTSNMPQGVGATILLNGDTLMHRTNYCPISGVVFVIDTLQ